MARYLRYRKYRVVFLKFLIGITLGYLFGSNRPPQGLCNFEETALECPNLDSPNFHPTEGFLYVGVMTAEKFLSSRVQVINDTWKHSITGVVEFFIGENAITTFGGDKYCTLPLRFAKGVLDTDYPPQKKSFKLFKAMHGLLDHK